MLILLLYDLSFVNPPLMISLGPAPLWLLLATDRWDVLQMRVVGIAAFVVAWSFFHYLLLVSLWQSAAPIAQLSEIETRCRKDSS